MLYLHVGTHKTGTSALQTFFAFRLEALDERGVHYLRATLGKEGHAHHPLSWAIRGIKGREMSVWDEARAEITASPHPIQVISTEAFWFTDPAEIRAQLEGMGEMRVVIYLRRQDKYLQSLYKQAVTGGRKMDFAEWLGTHGHRGDYLATVRQWGDAFGAENLIIRPYERRGQRVDVTADFFDAMGVDAGELLATRKARLHNPSPRREMLSLFRALNYSDIDFPRDKFLYLAVGGNAELARSTDILSYEQCVALMAGYDEANRELIERYYRDPDPLFPEMAPFAPPEIWDAESPEHFAMTIQFLRVVTDFLATGQMKPRPAKPGKPEKKKKKLAADAAAGEDG